ncbi:MAG: helix-turn-helix domain-containing protein [Pseudomonadota bacterium]
MKSYGQLCTAAVALDMVGERWTLLILRDLLPGPRRYGQLQAAFPGITTNLLAKRLKYLSELGLICKAPSGYALTEAGRRIEPVLLALAEFGGTYVTLPPREGQVVSARAMVLNLKPRFLGGWVEELTLAFTGGSFRLWSRGETLEIEEIPAAESAGPTVRQTAGGFAVWILKRAPLADLIERGLISVSGDADVATRLDARLRR